MNFEISFFEMHSELFKLIYNDSQPISWSGSTFLEMLHPFVKKIYGIEVRFETYSKVFLDKGPPLTPLRNFVYRRRVNPFNGNHREFEVRRAGDYLGAIMLPKGKIADITLRCNGCDYARWRGVNHVEFKEFVPVTMYLTNLSIQTSIPLDYIILVFATVGGPDYAQIREKEDLNPIIDISGKISDYIFLYDGQLSKVPKILLKSRDI